MTLFLQSMNLELENLARLDDSLESDPVVPAKNVINVRKSHNKTYYYHNTRIDDKLKPVYLGDMKSPKLHALARASYKKELMRVVKRNIKVLKKALSEYSSYRREDIMSKLSPCLRTVQFEAEFDKVMQDLKEWAKADYKKNSKPFNGPAIFAKDGTRVRSKSECVIYNMLLDEGIPFRYDCVMKFKRKNQYGEYEDVYESPDFVIMCPDGSQIIIEHGGMLESPQYASTLAQKLQLYQLNDYYMGYNLFVTSDTVAGGIDTKQIDRLIKVISARFAYL